MVDVLLVGLGSTAGLRAADDELVGALERAGASVLRADAAPPREVRTFMATDLAWARAARAAAQQGLQSSPRSVLYSTTTAALLWPRPGAIRFDALAADTRPGRHGLWQRPMEARRLRAAPLLVPMTFSADLPGPSVVVPIPVEPSGPGGGERDIAVLTYGANWRKKGLDRVLAAWGSDPAQELRRNRAGRHVEPMDAGARGGSDPAQELRRKALGTALVVAGVERGHVEEAWRAGGGAGPLPADVEVTGRLAPAEYRALLRRARVFVTAPRREDYGVAQLEALADGCLLVTTTAPGPYAALPLADEVVAEPDDTAGLAAAIARALVRTAPARDLSAFTRAGVDRVVAEELLPRLLASAASSA